VAGDPAVARPYAEAAYDFARGKGAVGDWESALGLLEGLVADPAFADVMRRPGVGNRQLLALALAGLGGEVEPGFASFLKVVVDNRRLEEAPLIRERFVELRLEEERTLRVTIRTAFPLDDAERGRIEETLSGKYSGRRIQCEVQVDPGLIGGARISVGDDVIDLSLRGQLERLAHSIRH